ncbi:hypothetical protein [Geochorda subterranea]|uniref:Uncharacterized protein n=1 Tax=Geochorda subterranea TaxID=3109564 RepID=A0ABZ1BSA1_9FIRM|nr:hypothetical protein [Limnochorda sp. LNt]WRP15700.1 hypothetical protein VLY81_05975 [Limnochorda sp. LNt]
MGMLAAVLLGGALLPGAVGRWAGTATEGTGPEDPSAKMTATVAPAQEVRGRSPDGRATSGEATAYEATVAVVGGDAEAFQRSLADEGFAQALRRRMGLGPDQPMPDHRILLRPVSGSPLVLVSAQTLDPDLASRLAHEAAALLAERSSGPPAGWRRQAQVLAATCSPPVMVRWERSDGPITGAR